jgi:hypothetical protein
VSRSFLLFITCIVPASSGCTLAERRAAAPEATQEAAPPSGSASERRTQGNQDLRIAGVVLTTLGSIALTSSTLMGSLALRDAMSATDANDDVAGYAQASLAGLALSHAALGGGIPMIVLGIPREPQPPSDVPANAPPRDGAKLPEPGVTTIWSF